MTPHYTVDEVAAHLRIGRSTVYKLMDRGELRYVEVTPRRRRISERELQAFIAARRVR